MHGLVRLAVRTLGFEGMDAVEPHALLFRPIGIEVRERRHMAARVPFLAVDGAGMAADADVQVDDQAQFFLGFSGKGRHVSARLPAS